MTDVYTSKGKPDPDVLKSHFIHEGRVEEEVAIRIIQQGLFNNHTQITHLYMYFIHVYLYTCTCIFI